MPLSFSILIRFCIGIQNIGIAYIVLLYSLPEPENHQSAVIVMIILYLALQPFYAILLINFIRKRCFKKNIITNRKTSKVSAIAGDSIDSLVEPNQNNDGHSKKFPPPTLSTLSYTSV